MSDKHCCCDHRVYGCDYTLYTEQLFPHYCNVLLLQSSVKTWTRDDLNMDNTGFFNKNVFRVQIALYVENNAWHSVNFF